MKNSKKNLKITICENLNSKKPKHILKEYKQSELFIPFLLK